MMMLPGRLARLTLGVALATLVPFAAQAAENKDPAPRQAEQPKKPEAEKRVQEQEPGKEKPSPAAKQAPLRFTDEDLERFHGQPPAAAEEEIGAGELEAGAIGPGQQALPGAGTPAPAPPAGVAGAGAARPVRRPSVRPPGLAPRPQDDPLKPFRDREAKEKFRTEQIQQMRDRLAGIDKRLEYLNARRLSVLDPLVGTQAPQPGEDAAGEASLRPRELLERIDAEIKGLEQEKEQARAELVSVETRFAQESQSR